MLRSIYSFTSLNIHFMTIIFIKPQQFPFCMRKKEGGGGSLIIQTVRSMIMIDLSLVIHLKLNTEDQNELIS